MCLNPMHSQRLCPLRQCSLCREFGHSELICSRASSHALKRKKSRVKSMPIAHSRQEMLKLALEFSDSE